MAGDVPLASFPRLCEGLADQAGTVQVDCRFERDAQRVPWLRGTLTTSVTLTCQRCLKPMALPVSVEVELALVHDEEDAERLSDDADYLVVSEQGLILAEILEDELLLAIPYIPSHESCELEYRNPEEPVGETRRENPFQVLAALKKPAADE
ncbi:YceD family protein [Fluviicoccus keumensis]|uniref:YceD family protein n=1 Tax=Fluviicoccus keumensis TaxID=1435465 RepID=UPI0013EED6C6|nr:YceD family protein [Fluviicoccus keumensis]